MNPKIRIYKGFFIALLMLVFNLRAMEEILADTQALVSAQADNPDEFAIQVSMIINAKTSDSWELFVLSKKDRDLVRAQHVKNKPYILARTLEQGENGCIVQYFDAHALNKALFGSYPITNLNDLWTYKNPVSNMPMQFLEYYECEPNKKIFEFMCSYQGWRSQIKKKAQFWTWRFYANQEDDLALVAKAKYNVAAMHFNGLGVPQNYQEALKIWQEVANQKDDLVQAARAKFNVAVMYDDGLGVPQDYQEALKIWQEVANQKDDLAAAAKAKFNIAFMYSNGLGVPQDYQEALKIWQEVANQKDDLFQAARAKFNVAVMYDDGLGVSQDHQKAFQIWQEVANQKEDLAEAAEAKHNVACAYYAGNGVQQNPEEARRLIQEVAQQTDSIEVATLAQKWLEENKV